ncbi:MAG TPA: DUF302 domain-containing protein [Kofleriaceae bacterium]|nr:DUF302 domain-containing protein [Kofleriaceae bacterium]
MQMPTLHKELATDFETALAQLPDALKSEGFGVLTKIDVKATLREKLGIEFRRYMILGACNPALAHRALGEELDVGVMLPCNVIVYEDDGRTIVNAIDPMQTIAAASPGLQPIAEEVRARLGRVLDRLS